MRLVRTLLVGISLAMASLAAAAEVVVSDVEAKNHVGQHVAVKGLVTNVSTSGNGTVFLNFGPRFPNHTFTAVIFHDNTATFPKPEQYQGKRVTVRGEVKLYHDKPEIILRTASQLSKTR
jgi:DNA/RNA endonuclease YhcR with UshA esterase domain